MIFRIAQMLLFTLSWLTLTQAQQRWSLNDCIAYAYENNPKLNILRLDESSAYESFKQSKRNLYLPFVGASTDFYSNGGRTVDPNSNEFINTRFFSNSYSVNASYDLFQAFQKQNLIKAREFMLLAAGEDLAQEKFMLAFRVMRAYYDLAFVEGKIQNAEEQLSISEFNYDYVSRQIELGLKAKSDLYEAEATRMADELNLSQALNERASSLLRLKQEMNWQEAEDLMLEQNSDLNVAMAVNPSVDSVFEKAKEVVPMIKAQELRLNAAEQELKVAQGALYPSLSANAGYRTNYSETFQDAEGNVVSFGDQWRNNNSKYVGVALTFPILNRWQTRSQIQQQKIEIQKANNALRVQELQLQNIIQQLVLDNRALRVELNQSDQQVDLQELSYEIAQKKYEKGMINPLEVRQAKNLFAIAQNENLQLKARLAVNQKTIQFYKGLSVFGIN